MQPPEAGPEAPRFAVRRGALHVDGAPRFLWSADYPYYRDDPAHWQDRLQKLAAAGIQVISCYVPWRHHAPVDPLQGGGGYDFDGRTQGNRDVKGFLRLVHAQGLQAVAKPGPFVHAELRYGGLPDYVDPDLNPRIEPEVTGSGALFRWIASREHPEANHSLPAPLDPVYLEYVRDWLRAVTEQVLAPLTWPRGPIVALQLMNEGICCDAGNGIVPNMGYSRASTAAYRAFLQRTYGSLQDYNRLHGTRHTTWALVGNPVRPPQDPVSRRAMLELMDRARLGQALYDEAAARCRHDMLGAGLDPDLPMYMSASPNADSYARFPGSNDGWYAKVAGRPGEHVRWGTTDWTGVAAQSARAYVQHVMAATRERGPNLEEDWGSSAQHDPAFAHAAPSYFQTLLHLACGATGVTVYTGVGTDAWRDDPGLRPEGPGGEPGTWPLGHVPVEHPGHAPVDAEGGLRPKYWTLAQLGDYLAAEGPGLACAHRAASLAWAAYAPYAWAGAWAPRGARDHRPWLRAGFRACPTVTYHGLESLVETALATGLDHGQVALGQAPQEELAEWPLLVLAGYDTMAPEAQDQLVAHVERGGHLLLTGLLPRWNDQLERDRMPLRERLFAHAAEEQVRLRRTVPVQLAGGAEGRAAGWAVRVAPPDGAEPVARIHAECVGYRVRAGAGTATYLGFHPWYAAVSGDDVALVEANRGVPAWAARMAGVPARWAWSEQPEGLDVFQANGPGDVQHLAVLGRSAQPAEAEVVWTRAGGARAVLRGATLPRAGWLVTMADGHPRSLLLKGVHDQDGLRIPPRLEAAGRRWGADQACDLSCVALPGGELRASVAHTEAGEAEVALGVPADLVAAIAGAGDPAFHAGADGGVRFVARDRARGGVYRVRLRQGAHPWWRPGPLARAVA